jgi:xanthine dehydrogenase large subunit
MKTETVRGKTRISAGLAASGLPLGDRPESLRNLMGATRYVDDLSEPAGMLHAVPVSVPSAKGDELVVDASEALTLDPRVRVLTAADIPGENQIGSAADDEPLIAEGEWSYMGEVVALVLAPDRDLARRAASLVRVTGKNLPPILEAREAFAAGELLFPSRTIRSGDVDAAFRSAAFVAEGRVDSGGQEHVYLETQAALAVPDENSRVRIVSSTQSPTAVQRAVSRVLAVPMNAVEVEAGRLGGGFGGKEDQATPWACLAALGAAVTGRPVKLVLRRKDDLRMTGKRHPYSSDFRIALAADGTILGFEADYYQNSGACTDLSPGILGRTLLHATGAYKVGAVRITGSMCRTNLPPFTAFRGFGGPQAFFVIESAIAAVSAVSGIPVETIQRKNLLAEGDVFYYGQKAEHCRARATWDRLVEKVDYAALRASIENFNKTHRLAKRGSWIIPTAFGISFTRLSMNEAGALVHVYSDGSVAVNTGAVEMGQGVNRKILRVVERTFGLPSNLVSMERTRTAVVANTQPTAASTGSDLNGMAALVACEEIAGRLLRFAAAELKAPVADLSLADGVLLNAGKPSGWDWKKLVRAAVDARVDLSAHGYYATPGIFYDQAAERGSPFAYHVYGAGLVVAELDVLRGTYRIVEARIVHDGGSSLDPLTDRGQVEGGFAQGLGWSILEELRFSADGRLLTDTLSTYKLPDATFMDFPLDIEFLKDAPNPAAILGSKAVGEPPLLYGIAGYFAVLDALRATRKDTPFFNLPMTGEKALSFIMGGLS